MEVILKQIRPWGLWATLISCLLNGVWLVCLFRLVSISTDTVEQAIQAPRLFRASVGVCVLLTIAAVPTVLTVGLTAAAEGFPGRALVGSFICFCYVPINLIAYYLYGMVFPRLVRGREDGDVLLQPFILSVDIGQPYALFGSLPYLGYGMLGLGWCVLASALLERSKLWRSASVFLIISGALSVIGAAGNFIDADLLVKGTVVGGMFSLPAFGLLCAALWQDIEQKITTKMA